MPETLQGATARGRAFLQNWQWTGRTDIKYVDEMAEDLLKLVKETLESMSESDPSLKQKIYWLREASLLLLEAAETRARFMARHNSAPPSAERNVTLINGAMRIGIYVHDPIPGHVKDVFRKHGIEPIVDGTIEFVTLTPPGFDEEAFRRDFAEAASRS